MSRSDRDWTIVQMLYRDPCPVSEAHPSGWSHRCEKYVAETPFKSEAERMVSAWLAAEPTRAISLSKIHYYPRNYVDQARQLRAHGRVIS